MGASRIEQLIEEIYEFIESCRMQPLSSTKVVVPKDELYDLLDELRLRTPDEIKRYQKIISNRDAILSDAERKSNDIIERTKEEASRMLDEHEIIQQAYYEANEVISQASKEAERLRKTAQEESDQIRAGSLIYCNEILTEVEKVVAAVYNDSLSKYDNFIGSLKSSLEVIGENKREVNEQLYPEQRNLPIEEEEPVQEEEDEYDFDEDTFIEGQI